MTEEEILRKKLDRLNENSHYGITIDTEITSIVRNLIKRLEDNKMKKATSVQNIKNVNGISFSIENYPVEMESKLTIVASTNDDIFVFEFEGPDLLQSCKATGLFTGLDKDQKIRELEEELNEWKKEASEYLKDVDGVRREKNKEINNLKQQLQQAANDNRRYEEKIKNLEHADMLDKGAADYWSKEHDTLSERFAKLQEENKKLKDKVEQEYKTECENCLACPSLVDDYLKLAKKNEQLTFEKAMIKKENDKLKKELALEKAANEAQHKFIREYAGKGTEVQFNYAIDDVKEVSYVIVEKRRDIIKENEYLRAEVKRLREKYDAENKSLSTRAGILDQAKKCVCGQREQDYGTPESNFQLIADLWNGYLGEKTDNPVISVTPVDVSMMMALMKIARIRNGGGSGDSFVDLAGYAACGGEIWHGQKAKDQN